MSLKILSFLPGRAWVKKGLPFILTAPNTIKISKTGERFICLFFKTDKFSGTLSSSDEGEVFWIKRADLENYVLADGFEDMVKVFENDELSEIYYGRKDGELFCEIK